MKSIVLILWIAIPILLLSQENEDQQIDSYSFDFVSVTLKDSSNSAYYETGRFTGTGEIHIYKDSITISWSNEWECGNYRLFVDKISHEKIERDYRTEWITSYTVRTKGYHDVDGVLTLIEGFEENGMLFTDILFDTNFTSEGWAKKRRVYLNVKLAQE